MDTRTYQRPTLIAHGQMLTKTQGSCTCKNEFVGFQPAPEEQE